MNWYLIITGAANIILGMYLYGERWIEAEKNGYDWKHMINHGVLLGIMMGIGVAVLSVGILVGLA
jgi:hypothetical protein